MPKKKHGLAYTKIYKRWTSMVNRCADPHSKRYGARGIKVCDRWRKDFMNFYNDMNDTFAEGLYIDRIDNEGDYTPENCRWVTPTENANNRSTNVDYQSIIPDGTRIGSSVVFMSRSIKKEKDVSFLCRCDCGYERYIKWPRIVKKMINKCKDCRENELKKSFYYQSLVPDGTRIGYSLVFTSKSIKDKNENLSFLCRCDCETERYIRWERIRKKKINRCKDCK